MTELLVRILVGGLVVSAFAMLGDLLKPKSFAGLFGAAPSVALATLALTIAKKGSSYAALEMRSAIAGAIALFVYASAAGWLLMRYHLRASITTVALIPLWLLVAFGIWSTWLRIGAR